MQKKRSRPKKSVNRNVRRWILTVISALVILLYGWVSESIASVRFPDSETPSLFYSTEARDDLRLTMSRAIRQAEKSIVLLIYTLTDPIIIKDLKNKSLEGCSVKVICDVKNSQGLDEALGPKVELVKFFSQGLMHLKILVIDEKQTWIGSANMTTASLRYHGNMVAAIDSQALAHVAQLKAENMCAKVPRKMPHQTFQIGGQKLELSFLPDDSDAVDRIKQLIRSAKKTVRIAMFTWTRTDFANAVIDAKNRGIDVKVAIDGSSSVGASAVVVELLKKHGVDVKVSRGEALLHHKFMFIDGKTLVNGSANWTKAAFKKNNDCFTIIHDLNEQQSSHVEKTWNVIENEAA
jgi:phosphatidylserine/phosphatidylglycerophosphate/cardiolipin synthase-like enzyme